MYDQYRAGSLFSPPKQYNVARCYRRNG